MTPLPVCTVTVAQMRWLDRRAQRGFGIPALILMEHAGLAVAREARRRLRRGPVVVLCSRGNNGGDGFVAARWLDNWGVAVHVVVVGGAPDPEGPAGINWQIVRRLKISVTRCGSARAVRRLSPRLRRAGVIVDALLGTGLRGPAYEPVASAIRAINDSRRPVVAVDVPSGLDADSGQTHGEVAVRATVTVTCGMVTRGLITRHGRTYAGRIVVADISLPRQAGRS